MASLDVAASLMEEGNDKEFYSEVASALARYLRELFLISRKGVTKEEMLKLISGSGYTDELCKRIEAVFNRADAGRFSPMEVQEGEMKTFLGEVKSLIEACEKGRPGKGGVE
jgi:hypothetical protein